MKPPLIFTCISCRKPIGVALEHSGKVVTCPHCRNVVKAPLAATVARETVQTPVASMGIAELHAQSFTASRQDLKEREESIFGEAIEEDDEALFGLGAGKKAPAVEMPETTTAVTQNTPVRLSPPTQRVPGLAPAPSPSTLLPRPQLGSQAVIKIPVEEADAESFTASASSFAASNGLPADANPFEMEAAIPTEFSESSPATPSAVSRRRKEIENNEGPNWKLWIMIGLGAYSFLITIVAIWGWTRSPSSPPVKMESLTPATQKAKPR